jgi:outer membrane receptor for ferrienterochelin and colicins
VKNLLLLNAFLSVLGPALCQDQHATVRIEVTAESSPVDGAEVFVNDVRLRTDATGIGTISLPFGHAKIEAMRDGFFPATTTIVIDEAREYVVTLELRPKENVEEQITVHATRTDVRIQDSPVRVEVLDRDEVEEETMMTPGDIVMMLNEMAGVHLQTLSPSQGSAAMRIQGMRGRYTRFLSDGLPLFGQQPGGLGLLQIPPMDLGQVEVIKGVASALYGAGAMAGVVNLIARRPESKPVYEFLVNQSTLGATDAAFFIASRLTERWQASLLSGGYWQKEDDRNGDSWADLAGYSRGVLKPRFFWDGPNGRSAFVTGGFTYENREGGTLPGSVLPATGAPYIESLLTRRYELGGSYQFLVAKDYVITARAAISEQDLDHHFGEVRERDRREAVFGELSARATWRSNTWVAGVAFDRDAYRPRDVPRFAYTYNTPGIFVQDDLTVARWLSLSASARVDFQNQYGTFFSPRFSALIHWKGWTSRISAGQGFFAPTPLTEETEAAGLTRLIVPFPIVAEKGRSASFDLTHTSGPFSYTATFFASSINHEIYVERTNSYELFNLGGTSRNLGAEFLATWRKEPFTATASYTFVNSTEPEPDGRVETPLTPRHSLGLYGSWEKNNWRIALECYYTGTQRLEDNPYRGRSEPYTLEGFLIERRLWKIRLFLNAENLSDVRQTDWDPLLRPTRATDGRWAVDAWAPLDGRVFNAGIRVRF